MFYEKDIQKEISKIDMLISKYNYLKRLKNFSFIGLFIPFEEKVEL